MEHRRVVAWHTAEVEASALMEASEMATHSALHSSVLEKGPRIGKEMVHLSTHSSIGTNSCGHLLSRSQTCMSRSPEAVHKKHVLTSICPRMV